MTAANITNLPSANLTVANLPARLPSNIVSAIIPRTYQDTVSMAQACCRGGVARKFENDPSRVAAIMMSGMEIGLKPMAALRLFYLTPEGQPALLARGMLAVVQNSGLLETWEDRLEGEGDARRAVVVCKRRGLPAITRGFSFREAKQAGLLNKTNWGKYSDRMMWNRAVSYALNDMFADLLGGLYDPSELGGPVIDDDGQVLLPPPDEPKVEEAKKTTGLISVLLPGEDEPMTFPRNRGGARSALTEIAKIFNEGHTGIVGLNHQVLTEIAIIPTLTAEVEGLRAAAVEAEIAAEEAEPDEPDTFVQDFVDGVDGDPDDDEDFPGDIPPKP